MKGKRIAVKPHLKRKLHTEIYKKKTCNNNRARDKKDSHFFLSLRFVVFCLLHVDSRTQLQ